MKRGDRAFLGVAAFLAAGALAYCSVMWFGIAVPRYYPSGRVWKWTMDPGVPSQGWFAAQAFALAVGALAGGVVAWASGRGDGGALGAGRVRAVSVATVLVLAGCLGYLMWHEFVKWDVF